MRTAKIDQQQSHQTDTLERIWRYALPPMAVLLICLAWAAQTFAGDVKFLSATSTAPQSGKPGMGDGQSVTAVNNLPPDGIESYLKQHPVVVVQFTSPDRHCGFCVAGFAPFNEAALTHGRLAKFVRVQWSPWQVVPKNITQLYQVDAVPVQYAFRDGRVVGQYFGQPDPIKFDAWLNKQFGATK